MRLVPLALAALALAAPASAAGRPSAAAGRPSAAAARPSAATARPAAAPELPRDEAALAAFGAALDEDAGGLRCAEARPGSPAAALGLRSGDRVWAVDRGEPRTRAEAAAARRQPAPEERESLVARRGLAALAFSGADAPAPPDFARGAADLSGRERGLAAARAARDAAAAKDAVAEAPPLDWSLRADQAVWVRFPDGLPAGLKAGDAVAAEAATGLTTDGSLDFLAIPPRSRLWARVVSSSDDGSVRTLRLVFYKAAPSGAHVYPILGAATALAGVPSAELARATPGGTLVVAAPPPPADGKKRGGKDLLLDSAARLRVRLLEPVDMAEPPSWWRAGPGLWLKTAVADGRRRFQVSHLVAGRAAAAAGLKIGDLLDAVDGKTAERLDFEDALDRLYGAPGSTVKVSVLRAGKPSELSLVRGVKFDGKTTAPLPLPFETR